MTGQMQFLVLMLWFAIVLAATRLVRFYRNRHNADEHEGVSEELMEMLLLQEWAETTFNHETYGTTNVIVPGLHATVNAFADRIEIRINRSNDTLEKCRHASLDLNEEQLRRLADHVAAQGRRARQAEVNAYQVKVDTGTEMFLEQWLGPKPWPRSPFKVGE